MPNQPADATSPKELKGKTKDDQGHAEASYFSPSRLKFQPFLPIGTTDSFKQPSPNIKTPPASDKPFKLNCLFTSSPIIASTSGSVPESSERSLSRFTMRKPYLFYPSPLLRAGAESRTPCLPSDYLSQRRTVGRSSSLDATICVPADDYRLRTPPLPCIGKVLSPVPPAFRVQNGPHTEFGLEFLGSSGCFEMLSIWE